MKLKIILSVLLLFSLLKVDANSLANKSIASDVYKRQYMEKEDDGGVEYAKMTYKRK